MSSIRQAIARGAEDVSLVAGGVSFDLRLIPSGVFYMGSPPSELGHKAWESPVRKVTISRPFYLGRTEVTQRQYKAIMGKECRGYWRGDDLPAIGMQLPDVLEFCKKLTAMVGVVVSLPTSAQWEYACRAGTTTRFYSGDDEAGLQRIAWYRRNANANDGPRPVGTKAPNAFGLYDMLGNVWEFCRDDLDLATARDRDPVGVVGVLDTSMRGGGWDDAAEQLRCASVGGASPMNGTIGFRISIDLPLAASD